ncbi:MAG: hypothetical protein ACOVOR_04200 [Rhabdochlamydiaceae bacterium]
MTTIIQNFYKEYQGATLILKDYHPIKTQVTSSIVYAATLICLSCIFSSSLKRPGGISFLANKAGLLLQESAKLGLCINLFLSFSSSATLFFFKRGERRFDEEEHKFLCSVTCIFKARTITNLALYYISFLMIGSASTLKLSSSLMRYSFLVLTHLVTSGFYAKTNFFSGHFWQDYYHIAKTFKKEVIGLCN